MDINFFRPIDSTKLSFLQTGIGAVSRTVRSKLRERVSVTDFGAVGNGIADDTAAIQLAINAVAAAGGGVVYFPAGTYKTTLTLNVNTSSVYLQGQGKTNTTIAPAHANDTLVIGAPASALQSICVSGMTIDPSVAMTTNKSAIAIQGNNINIDISDVLIKDAYFGIYMDSGPSASNYRLDDVYVEACVVGCRVGNGLVQGVYITRSHFALCSAAGLQLIHTSGVYVANCDLIFNATGISFDPTTPSIVIDCFFSQVSSDSNTAIGWSFAGTGTIGNITCSNCWAAGNDGLAGVYVNSAALDSFTWTGGMCILNEGHGFFLNAGRNILITGGVQIQHNSKLSSGASHGVVVTGGASLVSIVGNTIGHGGYERVNGAAETQGYGIIFTSASTDNFIITSNHILGNVTGAVALAAALGSTRVVKDNTGFVTEARGTATVPSGTAGVAVAHGLANTPTVVFCHLLDTGGGSQSVGANIPTVSGVGSANFTFNIGVVVSANRPFSWEAKL